MKPIQSHSFAPTTALALCMASVLAGCGGGDATVSPAGATPTPMTAAAEFNAENYALIAQSVTHALTYSVNAMVAAVKVHDLVAGVEGALHEGHDGHTLRAGHGGGGLTFEPASAMGPTTLPCERSGHLEMARSSADFTATLAGAILATTAQLQRCGDPAGWTLDGHYAWATELGASNDPSARTVTTRGAFQHLSISHPVQPSGFTLSSHGHGTIRLTQRVEPVSPRSVEAAVSLESALPGVGAPLLQTRHMKLAGSFSGEAPAYGLIRVLADGEVVSSAFGHAGWTVHTLEPLVFATPYAVPTAGLVSVSSPSGSRIRLLVLPGSRGVSLELDSDGDGVPEASMTAGWNELSNKQ